MTTVSDYVDQAMERTGITSYRQLSLRLGFGSALIASWVSGHRVPEEGAMIRLADTAGIPAETALLDLGMWRAERNNDLATLSVYASLKKVVKRSLKGASTAAVVGVITLISNGSAEAATIGAMERLSAGTFYIM